MAAPMSMQMCRIWTLAHITERYKLSLPKLLGLRATIVYLCL